VETRNRVLHPDAADTGVNGSGPSEQMQREADKGAKTAIPESPDTWPIKISRALLHILRADRKQRARLARLAPRNRAVALEKGRFGALFSCYVREAERQLPGRATKNAERLHLMLYIENFPV
jgi:hypothetical protein